MVVAELAPMPVMFPNIFNAMAPKVPSAREEFVCRQEYYPYNAAYNTASDKRSAYDFSKCLYLFSRKMVSIFYVMHTLCVRATPLEVAKVFERQFQRVGLSLLILIEPIIAYFTLNALTTPCNALTNACASKVRACTVFTGFWSAPCCALERS